MFINLSETNPLRELSLNLVFAYILGSALDYPVATVVHHIKFVFVLIICVIVSANTMGHPTIGQHQQVMPCPFNWSFRFLCLHWQPFPSGYEIIMNIFLLIMIYYFTAAPSAGVLNLFGCKQRSHRLRMAGDPWTGTLSVCQVEGRDWLQKRP